MAVENLKANADLSIKSGSLKQFSPIATATSLLNEAVYYIDGQLSESYIPTTASGYMYLPGVASNYASAPDSAALSITGDIDIRVKVACNNWIPSATQTLLAKFTATGNQRSYLFQLNTNGTLALLWSTNGTNLLGANSTVNTGLADGAVKWVRATLDVNNGAAGKDVTFYVSDNGTSWTQLGDVVTTATTTSIFDSTALLEIGSFGTGASEPGRGKFYRAQVLNGIAGTTVFDANFETAMTSQTVASFTESSTNAATVTVNRNTYNFQLDTINNLGTAGALLPTTLGSSIAADSNDPRFLDHTGTNYVYLPGVAGNYLSVPDSAALDITGDIDLRAYIAMDAWGAINQTLISKYALAGNRSYWFALNNGKLVFEWTADGTTNVASKSSSVNVNFNAGQSGWVRITLDVDNGASGNDVKFYTSTDGTTWTQLGTTQTTAGTTSIFASASQVEVGTYSGGIAQPITAKVFRAQIFNGIDGTKVLDVDTSTLQTGADAYIVPVTYSGAAGARFDGSALVLNGTAGNYASVPDSAALDVTGDIDIRVKVAMDDWTPSATSILLAKRTGPSTQTSYGFYLNTNGTLSIYWSVNGSTVITKTSTVAPTITDGSIKWVRVTLDVDNGASGNTVTFYTSDDGTTWTQLGNTVVSPGTTSILAGTAILEIGSQYVGTNAPAAGKFYQAQVLNGIDGSVVFNANFEGVPADSLTTIDSARKATVTLTTTRYCTINRSTSGRKTVAVTQPTWLFGTDDYMEVNNRYMASGTYLYLPGVASNYASAPDSAALDITGDIDLRCKVALDDWTPGTVNLLLAKRTANTSQISYGFYVDTNGTLAIYWSTNGTTPINKSSTVAPTISDGATKWVRVTLDVDNGTSGNDVKFYTSDDGSTWTQLGNTVTTAGTTSIFNSTAVLEIGAQFVGTNLPARGKFFRAQVLNGIDGTVAFDANFESSITSLTQTTFTESSANAATVTINRSGSAYRSAGITAAGYLYPGATNTFSASATDFLNFGASDSFTVIVAMRRFNNMILGAIIGKSTNSSPFDGWYIRNIDGSTVIQTGLLSPISGSREILSPSFTAGSFILSSSVINRNTQLVWGRTTGTSGTSGSISAVNSLSNIYNMRIGSASVGSTTPNDMEFYAAAIWRRPLLLPEIGAIYEYFNARD